GVARFQSDLAESYTDSGRVRARQRQFPEAFAALDAGLAIRLKLVEADPKNTEYRQALADSHACRGGARGRAGQHAGAAADLRRAVELWAKDKAPTIEMRFERARALALLAGLGKDDKSGVSADEAKAFAGRAVEALADAIKAGSSELAELK